MVGLTTWIVGSINKIHDRTYHFVRGETTYLFVVRNYWIIFSWHSIVTFKENSLGIYQAFWPFSNPYNMACYGHWPTGMWTCPRVMTWVFIFYFLSFKGVGFLHWEVKFCYNHKKKSQNFTRFVKLSNCNWYNITFI